MLVDLNYPFGNVSTAVHGLTKTNKKYTYNLGSSYYASNIFSFSTPFHISQLRIYDITVDIKTTYSGTGTSYYRLYLLYNNNASAYTNHYATSVKQLKTETIDNRTVYTMRCRFRYIWHDNYYGASASYNISGMQFYAYCGYSTAYAGFPPYNNTTGIDCEIVSFNDFLLTKDLSPIVLSLSDEYKTGIYPNIKIASRAPSDLRLPVSVKANYEGNITNAIDILVNRGSNTNILTNYCKNAIVQNILDSNVSEEFKLYQFTAFDSELTIDYPVQDYYDRKPVLKVYNNSTQNISFGPNSISTPYLRQPITAIERYDGKSLKLDLKLVEGSTYYILVATGPKAYFKNNSRNYPGSLYIYHDENANYSQPLWAGYGVSITNSLEIEADKTYRLIDYINTHGSTNGGFLYYYKFTPKVSGAYNIKLSNFFSSADNYGSGNSYNQMRLYMYNSSGSQLGYVGYYNSDVTLTTSNLSSLNMTAGTTYYFGLNFRYGYYTKNVDFKISLVTQGTTPSNSINIGAIPIDRSFILDTDSSLYGSKKYDYDTPLYFKMYLYNGVAYTFSALAGQGRQITAVLLDGETENVVQNLSTSNTTFTSTYVCNKTKWYILKLTNYSSSYTSNDGYCDISILGYVEGDKPTYGRSLQDPVKIITPTSGTISIDTRTQSGGLYYAYRDSENALWFELDCIQGKTYKATSKTYLADDYIVVYNNNGSLIGSNDDGGDGTHFSYSFTASYTGKYYYRIGYWSSNRTTVDGYTIFDLTVS